MHIEAWRNRAIDGEFPYLYLDGLILKRSGSGTLHRQKWGKRRYLVLDRLLNPAKRGSWSKFACAQCETLVQAPAPSRPIARGLGGPGMLAHVLVSKYTYQLPLYRQSQIYARDGIDLDRSTLADWVGGASKLLQPLVHALGRYVLNGHKLHADDTPVAVLCPGRSTSKQGRGLTSEMIAPPPVLNLPQCCSDTHRTAKAIGR